MELKDYQIKVVDKLKEYLFALDEARKDYLELLAFKPNLAKFANFPKEAWDKSVGGIYHSNENGGLFNQLFQLYKCLSLTFLFSNRKNNFIK